MRSAPPATCRRKAHPPPDTTAPETAPIRGRLPLWRLIQIDDQGRLNLDCNSSALFLEAPFRAGSGAGGHDQCSSHQITRVCWYSLPCQVFRSANDHPPYLADPHANHGGVRQISDSKSHVEAFLGNIDDPIDEQDICRDLRMHLQKLGHRRHDEQLAEQHWCGDCHISTGFGMRTGCSSLGRLDQREYALYIVGILNSSFRQVDVSSGSGEESRAYPFFQSRHSPCHGGRRQSQVPRGGRETLAVGDGLKDSHFHQSVQLQPSRPGGRDLTRSRPL